MALEWVPEQRQARTRSDVKPELARAALRQRPESARLHHALGTALAGTGAISEAAVAFRQALLLEPRNMRARFALGMACAELAQYDEALVHLRESADGQPTESEPRFHLARILERLGRPSAALQAFQLVLKLEPTHFQALHATARLLLAAGDVAAALAVCDASLQSVPGNTAALAIKSQLLLEAERNAEWHYLVDLDRLISVDTLEPPTGFTDRATFHEALAHSIRTNPKLEFEPAGRTARAGLRGGLVAQGNQPEAILHDQIRQAVERYHQTATQDVTHPFAAAAPRRACLGMWGLVLQEGGHVIPHVHPAGWLSGVYYVRVPSGGAAVAGVLEIGCAEPLLGGRPPVRTVQVEPREGLLVLFPSYFYHRTMPTRSPEERICVAFDMAPA